MLAFRVQRGRPSCGIDILFEVGRTKDFSVGEKLLHFNV